MIDGGVAANNPTLVAMHHLSSNANFNPNVSPTDYSKYLVISLGTGSAAKEHKFNAHNVAHWELSSWLTAYGTTPIIDFFLTGNSNMVDLHLQTIFEALGAEDNYLRIQTDNLTGHLASLDLATKENLEHLVKVGEKLLQGPVSKRNINTGEIQPLNQGTNAQALQRFAKLLSEEKRNRNNDEY